MSLADVLLSNKQVVLSLVMVGGVMLFALALAVGPSVYAAGKQIMARRKAKQAAQLARKRKAQIQRKRAALAQAKARAQAQADAARGNPLPAGVREVYPGEESVPLTVTAATEPTAEQPIAAEPIAVSAEAEATAEPTTKATAETEVTADEEQPSGEFQPKTDLQDLLDSVFANDEQNERYAVLLRDTEVVSAESLLTLARQVAGELRARQSYQEERQTQ